jgi:hypothetical protein
MAGGQSHAWSQPTGRSRLKQRRIEPRSITELAAGGWPSASPLHHAATDAQRRGGLLDAGISPWLGRRTDRGRRRPTSCYVGSSDLAPMLFRDQQLNVGCRPVG